MTQTYTHSKIAGPADIPWHGEYVKTGEGILSIRGRDILYSVMGDLPDCASYVNVPGFVVDWKVDQTKNGLDLTEVDPIEDRKIQEEIEDALNRIYGRKYSKMRVYFWQKDKAS